MSLAARVQLEPWGLSLPSADLSQDPEGGNSTELGAHQAAVSPTVLLGTLVLSDHKSHFNV